MGGAKSCLDLSGLSCVTWEVAFKTALKRAFFPISGLFVVGIISFCTLDSFGATLEEAPRWPQTPGETPRGMGGEGGGGGGNKLVIEKDIAEIRRNVKVLSKNPKKYPFSMLV